MCQPACSMSLLRPWIAEVQVNALDLIFIEYFLKLLDIPPNQSHIVRHPAALLHSEGNRFISGSANQFIIHIDADVIYIRMRSAQLANEFALAHAKLNVNRMIVAEQFLPFPLMLGRLELNELLLCD